MGWFHSWLLHLLMFNLNVLRLYMHNRHGSWQLRIGSRLGTYRIDTCVFRHNKTFFNFIGGKNVVRHFFGETYSMNNNEVGLPNYGQAKIGTISHDKAGSSLNWKQSLHTHYTVGLHFFYPINPLIKNLQVFVRCCITVLCAASFSFL